MEREREGEREISKRQKFSYLQKDQLKVKLPLFCLEIFLLQCKSFLHLSVFSSIRTSFMPQLDFNSPDGFQVFHSTRYKTKKRIQTPRGMLDSGSKQTFIGFSCAELWHAPGRHTPSWIMRIATVIQDGKACRAASGNESILHVDFNPNACFPHLNSSYLSLDGLPWRCVRRRCWRWFNPPGPHVGQELVGNLSQHILGQPGHAQDVISSPVNIVSEWDKLGKKHLNSYFQWIINK